MTNEQLLDESEPSGQRKRPVFLTVLCILTWVGSAALLYFSWNQYSSAVEAKKQVQVMFQQISGPGGDEQVTSYLDRWIMHALAQAIAAILSVVGAIILWNRRKWGFFLYTAGQLLSIVAVVWFVGRQILLFMSGIELLMIASLLLIPIGFIVMYGINLKNLRR